MIRPRRPLLIGVSLAAAMLGSACSEAPAAGDCAKLFSHLVDLEEAKSDSSDADKAEHRLAIDKDKGPEFVERCERNIKAAQVTCSLKATTIKEIETCDKG
jgi:hypothetical protein